MRVRRSKQKPLSVGDRVKVIKSFRNETRLGREATVLRKGFNMWWIQFDDGEELAWRTNWLEKVANE